MEDQKKSINIFGARVHNLKNFDLQIPRNKLVVITGKSGSGKSSLAFNTIHAEGQRRYLETFNAYARQFLGNMERPDVDKITGLSPVVAIEQKTTSRNPRSTVGTVTEIYDYIRLLYSRVGDAYSYKTNKKMVKFSIDQIINLLYKELKNKKIVILSPIVTSRKGHYSDLFQKLLSRGYLKARIDGEIIDIFQGLKLDRYKTHDIEVVVDRLKVVEKNQKRILESTKIAMKDGDGLMLVLDTEDKKIRYFSTSLMCLDTGIAYKNPEPNSFSFNSPKGACSSCNGLGYVKKVDKDKIITNKNLSINQGAISIIDTKKSTWIVKQISLIAKKFNFSLDTPYFQIPKEAVDSILYGINDMVTIKLDVAGISKKYKINFEGIINFISDQYQNQSVKSMSKWAEKYMNDNICEDCNGSRLNIQSSNYKIADSTIQSVVSMDMISLDKWINSLSCKMNEHQNTIAEQVIKEIKSRITLIIDVGLSYLTLDRSAVSLSGGEAQRIRLATQIGTKLTNVLYILDEPSIGLHQKDNLKLIESLKKIRDLGNSVIVVEHDKDMIKQSDYIIDLGPGAGKFGGEIVSSSDYLSMMKNNSLTADYLSEKKQINVPLNRRKGNGNFLKIFGAKGNNLKNINVSIPLGLFCCVTGVSGSGKSTLINETLHPILSKYFYNSEKEPLDYENITGLEFIDKVISVNQRPIGRTPRSNPVTYTGCFSDIRSLFANLEESKIRGYGPGRFSFNVKGGRCEVCKGGGIRTIEMNFLPNVEVKCEECNGRRYNSETLEVKYKGKSIFDILNLTVLESSIFFKHIPSIYRKIKMLEDVGLGYVTLGQAATTLSGGEAQRIKLAAELSKRGTGKTLYILDEPTTGLHFEDIRVLLKVIDTIVNLGNSVVVIEHNLDVIKVADYIIDLGIDGGDCGGTIVCQGTPENLFKSSKSYTSKFLVNELKK
tara:strand:- start:4929 stop:7757 length:2829 start_codon:yes stop_codon:yes gene_type:complete